MKRLVLPFVLLFTVQCGRDSKENHDSPVETPDAAASAPEASQAEPASAQTGLDAAGIVTAASSQSAALRIDFQPKVGGEALLCSDKSDALVKRGQVFTDARLFISNLSLINDLGQEVRLALDVAPNSGNLQYVDKKNNSIALLNFLEPACASSDATKQVKLSITGRLPEGRYKEIRFQLGLPYPASAPELASMPSSMAPSDMGWMWQHFPADVQIEVNTGVSRGSESKILNSLTTAQKRQITLPLAHTQTKSSGNAVALHLDFAKLFKSTAATFVGGLEKACHNSNKPLTENAVNCAHAFKALGLAVEGARQPYQQSVFSVAK